MRRALAIALTAGLVAPVSPVAQAADRVVPVIDGFGPYKLGMSLEQAKAADKAAKAGPCGEFAEDRQCLIVNAQVFQEPAVLYAVLDEGGSRVEKVLAKLEPQLTRRRAYRCVRLSEKVFALLVVVYGSRYKQSYDQNRRPLPAVAWDGEESGRLIFEAKCRTHDEGNPLISVVERYPNGVKPPQVAKAPEKPASAGSGATAQADGTGKALDARSADAPSLTLDNQAIAPGPASQTSENLALAPAGDQPPPPVSAPVGLVEQSALGAPETAAAAGAGDRMAVLTRELAHARGKAETAETPSAAPSLPPPPITTEVTEPGAAQTALSAAPEEKAETGPDSASVGADVGAQGRYTVPLDVAPPAADPATNQQTITIGETQPATGEPSSEQEKAAPENPVVSDPGPVTVAQGTQAAQSPQSAAESQTPPVAPAVSASPSPSAVAPAGKSPSASDGNSPAVASGPQPVPDPKAPEVAPKLPETAAAESPPLSVARRSALEDVPPPVPAVSSPATPPAAPSSAVKSQPSNAGSTAPSPSAAAPRPFAVASLPPQVRPPNYREAHEPREPTDMEAPEPLAMPEEEELFRQIREGSAVEPKGIDASVRDRLAASPEPVTTAPPGIARSTPEIRRQQEARDGVSAAPVSLLSVARENSASARPPSALSVAPAPVAPTAVPEPSPEPSPESSTESGASIPERPALSALPAKPSTPAPEAAPQSPAAGGDREVDSSIENMLNDGAPAKGWANAKSSGFKPVLSGGWRRKVPVPPVRPWRERGPLPTDQATDA